MTLTQQVVKWANTWQYDFWWRQKYSIAYNSEAHRQACQIDIKIEYIEWRLAERAYEHARKSGENEELMRKTGQWMKEKEVTVDENLFNKIDLTQF